MRRTPMPPRAVPLLRSASLPSGTPLARSGFRSHPALSAVRPDGAEVLVLPEGRRSRSRPETGFPRPVKLAVRKRAGGGEAADAVCEGCWCWLGLTGGEFQHRAARGSGGCRDEVINGPSNCLLLCGAAALRTGCHGAAERRLAHLGMDAAGFWIKHGTTPAFDPRNVSVMLGALGGSGVTVWLAEDGLGPDGTGYLCQPPGEIA